MAFRADRLAMFPPEVGNLEAAAQQPQEAILWVPATRSTFGVDSRILRRKRGGPGAAMAFCLKRPAGFACGPGRRMLEFLEPLKLKAHRMHFLLIYELSPTYLNDRPAHRELHLRLAWEAHERGELVVGGALADPADRALLLFQGETDAAARAFAAADPYVTSGLVVRWSVRPWRTVVGEMAATPVRPAG
jgi:uncharacterized protein YciI